MIFQLSVNLLENELEGIHFFKSQNDLAKLEGIFVLNKQYMDLL